MGEKNKGLLKATWTSVTSPPSTHKEGRDDDNTPVICRESISISQFHWKFAGLLSTADLLFSLHLKIKPRASALALNLPPVHTLTLACGGKTYG